MRSPDRGPSPRERCVAGPRIGGDPETTRSNSSAEIVPLSFPTDVTGHTCCGVHASACSAQESFRSRHATSVRQGKWFPERIGPASTATR